MFYLIYSETNIAFFFNEKQLVKMFKILILVCFFLKAPNGLVQGLKEKYKKPYKIKNLLFAKSVIEK